MQGWLAKLGLGGLVSAGMLSVNVLVGSAIQVNNAQATPMPACMSAAPHAPRQL